MGRQLSTKKVMQVNELYFQGFSYDEIARTLMIAKGSVANIIENLKQGKFPEFKHVLEQVDALRELAVSLRKSNLNVGQTLVGLSFYQRIAKLGVEPQTLDKFMKMCYQLSPPEYPVQDFVTAALKLNELEQSLGKSYEDLLDDYAAKAEALGEIQSQVNQLKGQKEQYSQEVSSLANKKESLELSIKRTHQELELLSSKLKRLTEKEKDSEAQVNQMERKVRRLKLQTEQLQNRNTVLKKEVAGKEEILAGLQSLAFSEAELIRLRDKLRELAKVSNMKARELRENFFADLNSYVDILHFRKELSMLRPQVETLKKEKEILEQENKNLGRAIDAMVKQANQALTHIKNQERAIISSMDKLASGSQASLQASTSKTFAEMDKLLESIRAAEKLVGEETKQVIAEAVEHGKAMGRMEKVLGEREEVARLFCMLGDISSVPRDIAIKAPIVVLGRFEEWIRTNRDLKYSEAILSKTQELTKLLRTEATWEQTSSAQG